jgi:cysteine desulfuration protein SufE
MMELAAFRARYLGADPDVDDRFRLLSALGRTLPAMPAALKCETTKVIGCAASLWVVSVDGELLADSDSVLTKGVAALVLLVVKEGGLDHVESELINFDLKSYLGSTRTNGIPNMIVRLRELAAGTEQRIDEIGETP